MKNLADHHAGTDEERARWIARSCRITGQDQNLLRTERQVAEDILAAFATIRAEAKRDGARARARVAKLEAALNDLRPNVDYHGHKKIDAALSETGESWLERYEEALRRIVQWGDAYPLEVFPEPDLKRAHEVLQAHGMTLDAISATAMRHVVTGVSKIARDALSETVEA